MLKILILIVVVCVLCFKFFFDFKGPCDGKPCKDGSTCEPRFNETHVCLCLAGDYNYTDNICVTGEYLFASRHEILRDLRNDRTKLSACVRLWDLEEACYTSYCNQVSVIFSDS